MTARETGAVERRCAHLMHLPSGKCLGCGEQHQPLPNYKPGDDEAYLADEARPQPTPAGDIVERLQSWLDNEPNLSPAEAAQLADAIAAFKQQAATIAERDAEKRDAFNHGYLIAVANIVHLHDEPTIAQDVLAELGEGASVLKGLDLSDYDAKPLRKMFRELARLRANAKRRATLERTRGQ